jgi:2,4-dienoyl-CoA reductase-like NADH-dependent reductase (Old Yellow Enzyme family)
MPGLFASILIGPYSLRSRVLMAPMTRGRAQSDGVPTPVMADYYRQRASAGLIVSEATAVSPQAAERILRGHRNRRMCLDIKCLDTEINWRMS